MIVDTIITSLLWLIGTGFAVALTWFIYDELQHKHKAIITENNNGMDLTKIKRAKQVLHSDGSYWWKIRGMKLPVPRPPNDYLTISEKGHYIGNFIQLDGGELHPVKEMYDSLNQHSKEFRISVQPLTTPQRQVLVDQMIKAERQKGKTLAEYIQYAVPFLSLVIIIVCFLIFADEAIQPMIELGQTNQQLADKMAVVADKLDTVVNNRIHINDIETTGGAYNNTPPN